jgi:hypothetical protein
MNNYLDMLNEDTMEYILDIMVKNMEKEIRAVQSKITKLKNKLKHLSIGEYDYEPDDERYYISIDYNIISYSMDEYLFNTFYGCNKIILINVWEEVFCSPYGSTYISKILHKPTYLDILIHAYKSVRKTGDYHHIYLEGLNEIRKSDLPWYPGILKPNKNVRYFEFMLGS